MDDPVTVTAIELPQKTIALVDAREQQLLRRFQWAFLRMCGSALAAGLALAMSFIHPIPWFITQAALLFGYTVVNGHRFDRRGRELDDYRLERTVQGMFPPKPPLEESP